MGEHLGRIASSAREAIYVEIGISASMGRLWSLSQDTQLHPQWDLRFSRIIPIRAEPDGLARFGYEFRLPFHTIRGTGTSLGHRRRSDGQSTSVLKFSPADLLSPIGPGSGYWRFIPDGERIRFITAYNYRPGLGGLGRLLDRRVIRPALGWATAWSFDRLRLWAESDIDPEVSRNRWIIDTGARICGMVGAATLVCRSLAGPEPWGSTLLGLAVLAAAVMLPRHSSVPQAKRCLRRPPDRRSAAAPNHDINI
jgi:hypothetical protein